MQEARKAVGGKTGSGSDDELRFWGRQQTMCGIAGFVALRGGVPRERIDRMVTAQAHRGPNGSGAWMGVLGNCDVALGHNRLAIIDLSDDAAQPMVGRGGELQIVFNGEVYNYLELANDLRKEGAFFRTSSDTEVLLEALARWGASALRRLNGMWGMAVLDKRAKRLMLARDRLGVKPLYLYYDPTRRAWFFASEIKAILAGAGGRFAVNAAVLDRYLEQQQLDAQLETAFAGIRQLPAGTYVEIDLAAPPPSSLTPTVFWSLPAAPFEVGSRQALLEQVRTLIEDSVRLRLRSDVPVGVLLSGGLDSSVLAAAATRVLGGRERLHALGAVSGEGGYSEEPHMDCVARHLGCVLHKERLVAKPLELFAAIDRATLANDEPIGGLSNVAHLLLMERARDVGITVLLTGQGADELTCGYLKYLGFALGAMIRSGAPLAAAHLLAGFVRNGTVLRQFTLADARRYLPEGLRPARTDVRGPRLADASRPLVLGLNGADVPTRQALDLQRYSLPALLHYEDRMSMSAGREMRTPFLDYRLVELLQPLAVEYKLRHGWTKWLLRAAFADALPAEIVWRKDKQGFTMPEGPWVMRELEETIASMLEEPWLTAEWGLIDQQAVKIRVAEFRARFGTARQMRPQDVLGPILLERWARIFSDSLMGVQ